MTIRLPWGIFHDLLRLLGSLTVLTACYRLLVFVYIYFLRSSRISTFLERDAFALITGASDGIGRHLALELAQLGFNLVLHGRSQTKLAAVRADIVHAHPHCTVLVLVIDAATIARPTKAFSNAIQVLADELNGRPLTVLINNAGGMASQARQFLSFVDMQPSDADGVINLNAAFPVQLTLALLPLLRGQGSKTAWRSSVLTSQHLFDQASTEIESTTRRSTKGQNIATSSRLSIQGSKSIRKALIIYVGSLAGNVPGPYVTTYASAKAFGEVWAVALGREMAGHLDAAQPIDGFKTAISSTKDNTIHNRRIESLAVLVGTAVGTAYNKQEPRLFLPDASVIARAIIARVGCGKHSVVAYWPHAIQAFIVRSLPEWAQTLVITDAVTERRRQESLRLLHEGKAH